MKLNWLLCGAVALMGTGGRAAAQPTPPDSPFSWNSDGESTLVKVTEFAPPSVLGVSLTPSSVEGVLLRDQRPYGEIAEQAVRLARYDAMRVQGPQNDAYALVTIYLALENASSHLLCAFTHPAPRWAPSLREPGLIEELVSERWTVSPARYEQLQSHVTDVLRMLWLDEGVDPTKVGQIAIRPRLVFDKSRRVDADGNLLPPDPPVNMWIIEILGTFIGERYGAPLTTRIVLFRDGSLEFAGGMTLP